MFANQSEANDMPEASDLEYHELLARRAAKAALEGEEDGLADLISLLDDAPGGLQARRRRRRAWSSSAAAVAW